jgi:hypothetical protein
VFAYATAQSLKGHARKGFMKNCISNKKDLGLISSQSRMKSCNADSKAKTLKGDERKAFTKTCLRAK